MASRARFHLSNGSQAADLSFTDASGNSVVWIDGVDLHVLAVVEISKIPLCLVSGSPLTVGTDSLDLEGWFSHVLIGSRPETAQKGWWKTAQTDSQLGVLVSVRTENRSSTKTDFSVTELLIYATRPENESNQAPDDEAPRPKHAASNEEEPVLQVQALPLCSRLLEIVGTEEPTPPASPINAFSDGDAVFLSPLHFPHEEVIHEVQVRKRKSASDFFDEAAERKSKARRRGPRDDSITAAYKPDVYVPTLNHRRSISNSQHVSFQKKPLSRSPSVASSRPGTAMAASTARSSLSRMQSVAGTSALPDIGVKNKDSISRIVMAGMRLYGLSQKRNRKQQHTTSPAPELSFDDLETERKRDEEYKSIYHQAFKGTCFAFRRIIEIQDMQPMAEAIRDVVDRLLVIFCTDPLSEGLSTALDKLTPGGRKAFGAK